MQPPHPGAWFPCCEKTREGFWAEGPPDSDPRVGDCVPGDTHSLLRTRWARPNGEREAEASWVWAQAELQNTYYLLEQRMGLQL